jgi:predicted transcriptional regulator
MARPASGHPTELELAILKVLWQRAPRTVEQVRAVLGAAGRELTHSSVITVMNIMVRKGYLERARVGRAFEYAPRVAERQISRGLLLDLVYRVFDGSARAVVLELLEAGEVDAEELAAIRRMIRRASKEGDR